MPSDRKSAAYRSIIADIEREIGEHEAVIKAREEQIAEARAALIVLRRRLASSLDSAGDDVALGATDRPRKGDVTATVLEAVRANPGITGNGVADALESKLDSPAANKRKLVYSTISYLIKKGILARHDTRLYEMTTSPIAAPAPPLDDEDDDLPF